MHTPNGIFKQLLMLYQEFSAQQQVHASNSMSFPVVNEQERMGEADQKTGCANVVNHSSIYNERTTRSKTGR